MADDMAGDSLFSIVDLFILSAAGGFAVYWFFIRNKKQEQPTFKKLTVTPMLERQESSIGILNKMKNHNRNVVVFYGSQTGTAEEFATRLAKDASRYGMKGMVADPEECEMDELANIKEVDNNLAIFCMATYGEGDPTDNAQEFYEWLQSGAEDLQGLNYAVFALGNKTYEHFNATGKYVDKRLEELGGKRIFECGLGDDDANIEEDFVTWKDKFWPVVCEEFGVQATGEDINTRQYAVTVHDKEEVLEKVFTGEIARVGAFKTQKPPYDVKNPYLAPLTVNRELHKGGDRSCMHIELDISGSKIRYEAGDHVGVYPINDQDTVEKIGKRLGLDLDTVFTLTNVDEEASKKHPFPCPCSYRTALSHYVDIQTPPRTHVLRELSEYASDPKEKEFLVTMAQSTEEGKNKYLDWVVKDHRNILAVLEDLPSLDPPLDHILELLPRLQARLYSISSSPKVQTDTICITAVVVEYSTPTGRPTKGVATSWLKAKQPDNGHKPRVPIYVRKSQFRLPFKPSTPVIMIGPGTGLAPFRGFIQERDFLHKEGKQVGDTIVYFGCRRKSEDFIYEEELSEFQKNGSLTKCYTAFSRDQAQKVYVQHLLDQNKDETWNVLENNGHIYICGDARNMARDVLNTLERIIMEKGEMDKTKAEAYIKKLQNKGRYSADVWS
ncbi:NADPH--cytochrome P450 reductase-like isoform X2 [Littorina saxatilis]|uniref:NADPH--cytochrome P450 reductase n=2 Tax=Littorina saxatilis TaxID=31220 RepID=A0AAN9AJN1_9CAEN